MTKLFLKTKSVFAYLFLLMAFSQAVLGQGENLRLVISAGALAEQRNAFYDSRIFVGESDPPLEILAMTKAFTSDSTIFYSTSGLTKEEIASAVQAGEAGHLAGIIGPSYRGFPIAGEISNELKRYLGAESSQFRFERRNVGQKIIFAFNKGNGNTIVWPRSANELREMPAAQVRDKSGAELIVVARLVGDLPHRLGIVDSLLAKNSSKTAFIELGANHGEAAFASKDRILALSKRKPVAVFPGTFEMASLMAPGNDLSMLPNVYPFADKFRRTVLINDDQVYFWSAAAKEKLWPLYGKLGKIVNLGEEITAMKTEASDPNAALNIVRVFSEDAAIEAAKSVYVDLVLLLSKDPSAQLPSSEIIELNGKHTDSYPEVAPVVKVSYLDISEVKVFGPSKHVVQRVEIKRYPITDESAKASDVLASDEPLALAGLPDLNALYGTNDRAWRSVELDRVLGGITLDATGADMALFENSSVTTTINGAIPLDMAKQVLSPQGNVAIVTTSGKQIKRIIKVLKSGVWGDNLVMYGVDTKSNMIGGRTINDEERFTIALSRGPLLKARELAQQGGLGEIFKSRAVYIEAIYGEMNSLYFLGGPKDIAIADTAQVIEQASGDVHAGLSFERMVTAFLLSKKSEGIRRFIDEPVGRPHHVITFDLTYFDLGLSKNVANDVYEDYRKGEMLPMGRAKAPLYAHIFLFTKMALKYDAPSLQTTLAGEIKYMHTKLIDKPEKDKAKVGLTFRLPWERTLFKDEPIVVAPISKTNYETKLAPHFLSSHDKLPKRTQKMDTLLGFNFDFTNLGFNIDLGGVMVADFNRTNASSALDFGPGMNFYSKWSLFGPVELSSELTAYYLFPLPKNTADNKLAFGAEGSVWLRLMRISDFSVAAVSDFLFATLQSDPKKFAISSIFGLTLSYGRLFRLFG